MAIIDQGPRGRHTTPLDSADHDPNSPQCDGRNDPVLIHEPGVSDRHRGEGVRATNGDARQAAAAPCVAGNGALNPNRQPANITTPTLKTPPGGPMPLANQWSHHVGERHRRYRSPRALGRQAVPIGPQRALYRRTRRSLLVAAIR
jgi:hypothetical protein